MRAEVIPTVAHKCSDVKGHANAPKHGNDTATTREERGRERGKRHAFDNNSQMGLLGEREEAARFSGRAGGPGAAP